MVGDQHFLALGHHPTASLRTAHRNALDRVLKLRHADLLLGAPRRQDGALIDRVGQVGARETWRQLRQNIKVDVVGQRLALGVDLEHLNAAFDIRRIEHYLAIEATGADQRRVEHVGAVGRRDHDHVGVGVKAVHLDQDLVERLLALVVRAAQASTTLAADRVDLVDEDDARRVALGLIEQVAHAAGAHTDEHLDELRAGDREERHAGLARHRAREQRLAGAGRADHQDAARDARAQRRELIGKLEELNHLGQILFGLFLAGDIGEGDRRLVAGEHARAALAERERLVVRALRLAHEEDEEADHQQERQQDGEDIQQPTPGRRALDVHLDGVERHVGVDEQFGDTIIGLQP